MFLLFFVTNAFAQVRNCGTMEHLEYLQDKYPKIKQNMRAIEQHTQNFIRNGGIQSRAVITIPVVFHVVYNTSAENLSDAELQSQLQVLNEDFRRLNADADNTWPQAADTQIEFCLANVDPNGATTNGITRTHTNRTSFGSNDDVKFNSSGGHDAWPADKYLNFWVCDLSGGLLGYAQFPGGPANTDGVVCDYKYTGRIAATPPFHLGRTATHEVGHYLNLRHIWGDGGCGVDDFVADTPNAGGSNVGCATGHVSCGSVDMVENYMDYSDDACMNLFTAGQSTRMNAIFSPGGARYSLLSSPACGNAGGPSCYDGIQNGQETGVDCGGPDCPPCPTCNDGIQNGNETGVDCGGPDCPACPCTNVTVNITLDDYGSETTWTLTDAAGTTLASGGPYSNNSSGQVNSTTTCLIEGCYDFTIFDAYGDGICCNYGNGSYEVVDANNTVLASGSNFTSSQTRNFCVSGGNPPPPTCSDGVMNGQETGVDCGGPDCPACTSCNDGIQNGQETGVDCGGPDCPACTSCNDGIQNGNETGVDCGGPDCPACPTCNDGIQNGNETGVDCGGPDCPACTACNDGIQNGQETGVDCGGPDCPACPTCNDGIQNGNETGVDCGGPDCPACPTCNDGIQNGNETGVDCGGPDCPTCPCSDVTVKITLDNYGSETTWTLKNGNGQILASGGPYTDGTNGQVVGATSCLLAGCYSFTINDAYGDGICCFYGNGHYEVLDASGSVLASGNNFAYSQTRSFCIGAARLSSGAKETTDNNNIATIQEEKGFVRSLSVFPNPTADILNLSFKVKKANNVEMIVTDFTGKQIQMRQLGDIDGRQKLQIDVSQMTDGFYFVHFLSEGQRITKKFVVAR